MPKQIGSRQIRGKFGQECYYFRKGMQTGLYRGINQQMSTRVKTEPEFENTRLYAREFGYAGKLSSLSFIPSRLGMTININDNSQGKLTRVFRQVLNGNGVGSFGARALYGLNWQDTMVRKINEQCRVNMDINYPIQHSVTYIPIVQTGGYSFTWVLSWDDRLGAMMERNKLDKIVVHLVSFGLKTGSYDSSLGAYVGISALSSPMALDVTLTLDDAKELTSTSETFVGNMPYLPKDNAGTADVGNSILNRPMVFIDGYRSVGSAEFKQHAYSSFKILDQAKAAGV